MLTWMNRSSLNALAADPWWRRLIAAVAMVGMLQLLAHVLLDVVPMPLRAMVMTYLLVGTISLGLWPMIPRLRLWLTLLVGTTIWSLAMLALTLVSLLHCAGYPGQP